VWREEHDFSRAIAAKKNGGFSRWGSLSSQPHGHLPV
jgi:hypothetical protein